MQQSQLFEVLSSQRGRGWLGALEILEYLENETDPSELTRFIRGMMQREVGQQLIDKQSADDETVALACNGCIETVLQFLKFHNESTKDQIAN